MTDENLKGYRSLHLTREQAASYEENVYASDSYDSWIWEMERDLLLRSLEPFPLTDMSYMDFACGTGRILGFLEGRVKRAVGVDVSESMLAVARKKVKRAELILGDPIEDPSLVLGSFHLVTAFRFFLNAESELRKDGLRFIHSALDPEGLFILNVHGNRWSMRSISVAFRRLFMRQRDMNLLSYREMKQMLEANGFTVSGFVGYGLVSGRAYLVFGRRISQRIETALRRSKSIQHVGVNFMIVCKKA